MIQGLVDGKQHLGGDEFDARIAGNLDDDLDALEDGLTAIDCLLAGSLPRSRIG